MALTLEERFWKFTAKGGPDECWVWKGGKNPYGKIIINGRSNGAHRLSYKLFVGPIPKGMHVLHKCDNRPCVNPGHLFLGSSQNNIDDCIAKGRFNHSVRAKGAQHGMTKLQDSDIPVIRASSESTTVLADRYNIGRHQIRIIQRGKAWRHIHAQQR